MPKRQPRLHPRTAANVIRENPIKTAAATVTALGIILGGGAALDERWAHAAEFNKFVQQANTGLTVNRMTNEIGQLRIERALLQQRITDLQRQGPRARGDLERAAADLRNLDAELLAKKRQLDRIIAGEAGGNRP